jgi:hypothetical protein
MKRVIRERECYQGQGGGLHGRHDEIRVLGRTYEGSRESGATVENVNDKIARSKDEKYHGVRVMVDST